MTMALEAAGLRAGYASGPVLRGVDLRVAPGEIYALLGGNGAGKSTTMNACLGFCRPSAGSVRVCGIDPALDPLAARARLAYVPENVALYEHLSARENLHYLLRLSGADPAAADTALDAVGLRRDAWDLRLGGYSKGMRQKVAIALALARAVPVLLLDEPTSGLDPQASSEFNALLNQLKGEGVAIFMVTHDLFGAAEVADRIGFLEQGRIVQEYVHGNGAGGAARFDVQQLYRHYADVRRSA